MFRIKYASKRGYFYLTFSQCSNHEASAILHEHHVIAMNILRRPPIGFRDLYFVFRYAPRSNAILQVDKSEQACSSAGKFAIRLVILGAARVRVSLHTSRTGDIHIDHVAEGRLVRVPPSSPRVLSLGAPVSRVNPRREVSIVRYRSTSHASDQSEALSVVCTLVGPSLSPPSHERAIVCT